MLEIKGIHIKQFPFENLEFISNLISFEGEPFLQHFKENKSKDVIRYLVDFDDKKSRWLYSRVSKDELLDYLTTNISLKQLLSNLSSDLKFFVEFENENELHSDTILIQDNIDEKYLPKDESFFPIDIPDVYSAEIKNFNVRKLFLVHSVFMKAEPVEISKDRGLVKAEDAANLLWAVSESFDNKVEKEVEDKCISVGITDDKRIQKAQRDVGSVYYLNVAKLKVASFAVALCPNHLVPISESFLNREWLLAVLKSFKQDVIEIDKKSIKEVDAIVKTFNNKKDMRDIYEPLIKLYENKNITVSLTDSHFNSVRVLKPIDKKIVSKLIIEEPKKEQVETERLVKVKFNEATHKPKLSGYTLFEQDTNTSWETSQITVEEKVFYLTFPLMSIYNITNGIHIIENKILDIYATGEQKPEAIFDFNNQFLNIYNSVVSIKDIGVLNKAELQKRKYLDLIIQAVKQ